MPETPEAHKEIVEIKKEVRDIRQTQDAQIYQDREKWQELLDKAVDDDIGLIQVLLAVDGVKSAKDIETECKIPQKSCWNRLNRLEKQGIVAKADETKKGSPVFVKSRWYRILRLDEYLQKKNSSLASTTSIQAQTSVQVDQVGADRPGN